MDFVAERDRPYLYNFGNFFLGIIDLANSLNFYFFNRDRTIEEYNKILKIQGCLLLVFATALVTASFVKPYESFSEKVIKQERTSRAKEKREKELRARDSSGVELN